MSDPMPTVSRAQRGFRRSSMAQLTLVRFREFIREPEAVFWTFVFPILLAAGLGIAFRSRPPERPKVMVLAPDAGGARLVDVLRRDPRVEVVGAATADDSLSARELRTGRIALVIVAS